MKIFVRNAESREIIDTQKFSNEEELEAVLKNAPQLLREDGDAELFFVDRQVELPEAGKLDLLYVTEDGLPVAVEVKLKKNGEARRTVVGQAVDYLSSLTNLTVDELDLIVGGRLESTLRENIIGQDSEDEDAAFERVWRTIGINLRAGKARLVIALDEAPPSLERIFHFLARNSALDVQLLTLKKYKAEDEREIYVPQSLVNLASDDRVGFSSRTGDETEDWDAYLMTLNNKDMVDFIRDWRIRGEKSRWKSKVLSYPSSGEMWRPHVRKDHMVVMQNGRFEGDVEYWGKLSQSASVKILRDGTRLHFTLKTKQDFELFWQSITKTLRHIKLVDKYRKKVA